MLLPVIQQPAILNLSPSQNNFTVSVTHYGFIGTHLSPLMLTYSISHALTLVDYIIYIPDDGTPIVYPNIPVAPTVQQSLDDGSTTTGNSHTFHILFMLHPLDHANVTSRPDKLPQTLRFNVVNRKICVTFLVTAKNIQSSFIHILMKTFL